jgi:hypothetical protein
MEGLFSNMGILPFLDDIAIVSKTKEKYIAKVGKVCEELFMI